MRKIGLFFDYDGVLAPITQSPVASRVPPVMLNIIRELQRDFEVAVVSGRDCPFLYENTPDLDGYACIYGLEVHGGNYAVLDEELYRGVKPRILEKLASRAMGTLGDGAGVILGKTLTGVPAGMSIYWYTNRGLPHGLNSIVDEARSSGLAVYDVMKWGDYAEFIDIHVARRSKRDAVRVLRALLEVDRVVYFGDSISDLPALAEADVSVFVKHRYNGHLEVAANYVVNAEDLGNWLIRNKHNLLSS